MGTLNVVIERDFIIPSFQKLALVEMWDRQVSVIAVWIITIQRSYSEGL